MAITGINRQQRSGSSYMHGVLRDAARPFAYRGSARRLLHAAGSCRMRPLYGNGFIPVDFKYLAGHYGYEYGSTESPPTLLPPGKPGAGQVKDPMAAVAPSAGMPEKPAFLQRPAPAGQVPPQSDTPSAGIQSTRPARTVDIRIPGGAGQKTAVAKAPEKKEQGGAASTSPVAQALPQPVSNAAESKAAMPQRLPPNLSLNALARMLEQQNFELPAAAKTAAKPDSKKNPAAGLPQLAARPAIKEENRSARGHDNAVLRRQPASVVAAAARPSAKVQATASAQLARLQPPPRRAPRPLPPEKNSAQEPHAPGPVKTGSAHKRAHAPAHKPLPARRVTVIRRSVPAAFWERSYLSHSELRIYR